MTGSEEVARLKKAILSEYPRMKRGDSFRFACHGGLACFNSCCADVNIFLTPYDVLRLKRRLGISSQEFLDLHTILPIDKNLQYPVLLLKLGEDGKKRCPFVDPEKGCTVYEDRPWACRMYPVGLASPKDEKPAAAPGEGGEEEFFFLMKEEGCLGFGEDRESTVAEWMENQGVPEYDAMGRLFKEITLHDFFKTGRRMTPEKMEMFFVACYNLDKFRGLLFDSSFFDRFEVGEELKGKLKTDDEELLRFGFRWLRFSLFGEPTMKFAGGGAPSSPQGGGENGAEGKAGPDTSKGSRSDERTD